MNGDFVRLGCIRESERGATAVEYGIMIALIAVVIFGAVTLMGDRLGNKYDCVASIVDGLPTATTCP